MATTVQEVNGCVEGASPNEGGRDYLGQSPMEPEYPRYKIRDPSIEILEVLCAQMDDRDEDQIHLH